MRLPLSVCLVIVGAVSVGLAVPKDANPAHAASVALQSGTEPNTDRDAVLDLTFPVPGPVTFADDYDEPRGDRDERVHQAGDVYAPKLARVHAVAAGTVCVLTAGAIGGWQVSVCGEDGLRTAYTHLNDDVPTFTTGAFIPGAEGGTEPGFPAAGIGAGGRTFAIAPGIVLGARVQRRQLLGWAGDSGNAAVDPDGPQLHLSLFDPELQDPTLGAGPYRQGYRNPYPSLRAAVERGDVPADARPLPARRLAGSERIGTAVAISHEIFPAAGTVVIAPADRPAPALVGAPLAAALGGPVLLSRADALPDAVAAEVRRLGARHALLLGGPFSAAVPRALRAAGITKVERIEAGDDAALSALVAGRLPDAPSRVLLARSGATDDPRSWPDALAAAALGAARSSPVLLTPPGELAAPVAQLLERLRPALVEAVGGPLAVSDEALQAAGAAAGAAAGRLGGADRYATAVAVARAATVDRERAPEQVWLASGRSWPDALVAGPAVAATGGQLLLVDGHDPAGSPASAAWLLERAGSGNGPKALVILGGMAAIGDSAAALAALVAAR